MQLCPANENAFAASFAAAAARVGALVDDRRRRVPELELHALPRRAPREVPADPGRAGERDELHALVLDERVADLGRRAGDDVQPPGREPGLLEELGEEERRERRRGRGLEHDRAAGGERRRDLVGDEVEREVERADRGDDRRSGARSVNASLPSPAGDASIGTTSPASRRASTAANVQVETARSASTRAAFSGLPASAQISAAASSRPAASARAAASRIAARRCAGSGSASAAAAASSARRVSAAPPRATRPTTSPEYGEATSIHAPVDTRSPPIRSSRSGTSVATRASLRSVRAAS